MSAGSTLWQQTNAPRSGTSPTHITRSVPSTVSCLDTCSGRSCGRGHGAEKLSSHALLDTAAPAPLEGGALPAERSLARTGRRRATHRPPAHLGVHRQCVPDYRRLLLAGVGHPAGAAGIGRHAGRGVLQGGTLPTGSRVSQQRQQALTRCRACRRVRRRCHRSPLAAGRSPWRGLCMM